MAKTALGEGRSAAEQINMDRRTAAKVLSNMSTAQMQVRTEQAKMKYDANRDNIKDKLESIKIRVMDDYKRAVLESDKRTAAYNILQKISSDIRKTIENAQEKDQSVSMAQVAIRDLADQGVKKDDPRMLAAKEALKQARAGVYFEVQMQLDMAQILDIQQRLRSMAEGNGRATPATEANWGEMTVTGN